MSLWLLTLVLVAVQGEDILNEPDWGFQSYLDEDYRLVCNHSDLVVQAGNAISWQLPDGTHLAGDTGKFMLTDGSVAHMYLTVKNVQEADAGVYVCHVYTDMTMSAKVGHLLRGLNIGGHKYRAAFDEYRENLMIGGIAAAALFVPLVTACFVYKYRFQTKEQKAEKRQARLDANKHQRYLESGAKGTELTEVSTGETNTAYVNDEVKTRL